MFRFVWNSYHIVKPRGAAAWSMFICLLPSRWREHRRDLTADRNAGF